MLLAQIRQFVATCVAFVDDLRIELFRDSCTQRAGKKKKMCHQLQRNDVANSKYIWSLQHTSTYRHAHALS
jgi:hypothetical protein